MNRKLLGRTVGLPTRWLCRPGGMARLPFLLLMAVAARAAEPPSTRLPDGLIPVVGCWFWSEPEFEPEGYRHFLDEVARRGHYNLLTTSLRVPEREVTDAGVREQIGQAAAHARSLGMGIVLDLDVRLARAAFARAHPDELQEMLRLREVALADTGEVSLTIKSETLSDHYTHRATPYVPLAGRLVRVYSYTRAAGGIDPASVREITDSLCRVEEASPAQIRVVVRCSEATRGRCACVMAAFTHFTPDVFAPHLMSFQREILASYAALPLAGCCKDEWGFPPDYTGCPEKNDYWFSRAMAAEYAREANGRDLAADMLLMWSPHLRREAERIAAINRYQELCWRRNAALEADFHHAVKATFGPDAFVGTHATWWPHPDRREFKKNGLDWWAATRDWAQTDETTPFSIRTALAKKWGSPVWFNMFYSPTLAEYERELWAAALAGGRVNYHPYYPTETPALAVDRMPLAPTLVRGDCRVRLLNYITKAPLDCPAAVLFGHGCAMNWAGPAYDDVGLAVADALWQAGYPTDLIPADEVAARAVTLDDAGRVRYGTQAYSAVVLYHPEFERPELAAFLEQAAAAGRTALFRVGDWSMTPDGRPFAGNAALPPAMRAFADPDACATAVVSVLTTAGVTPQTPATIPLGWDQKHPSPPRRGTCRLTDGTVILLAGEQDAAGDPLEVNLTVNGCAIRGRATGVFALRLGEDGALAALAAGELRQLAAPGLGIDVALDAPLDLALWRDADGHYRGVVQDWPGPIPHALLGLTPEWQRLAVPPDGSESVNPAR